MKKAFFISIFFITTTAHATSFYCSTQGGNGYVNTGDTMNKVQATCGVPTSTYQQQTSNVMQQQIQTWIYAPRIVNNNNTSYLGFNNQGQQISVSFQIINNQITAISSSQHGPQQQWTCPNGSISVGANANQLTNACGQPTTINNTSQQVNVQPHNLVYWTYQVNQYSKPIIMEFQDGYLIQAGPQQ